MSWRRQRTPWLQSPDSQATSWPAAEGQQNQQQDSITESDIANIYVAARSASKEWVMDGAATHLITPHKRTFSSLESTGILQLTQVAGPTAASEKGTVRLIVKQPQKQPQIVELREVLWVPTAWCQLFREIGSQRAGARVSAKGDRQIIRPGVYACIHAQLGASSNPTHTNLFTFIAECINSHAPSALACTGC